MEFAEFFFFFPICSDIGMEIADFTKILWEKMQKNAEKPCFAEGATK